MARDYGNPQHRADRDSEVEQRTMRRAMASAHSSYTVNSMNSMAGSVEVQVDADMSVFGDREQDMMGVVFSSCFARFRAEARYGEMEMTFSGSGRTWTRDTY